MICESYIWNGYTCKSSKPNWFITGVHKKGVFFFLKIFILQYIVLAGKIVMHFREHLVEETT
jgi:hypothetical protein